MWYFSDPVPVAWVVSGNQQQMLDMTTDDVTYPGFIAVWENMEQDPAQPSGHLTPAGVGSNAVVAYWGPVVNPNLPPRLRRRANLIFLGQVDGSIDQMGFQDPVLREDSTNHDPDTVYLTIIGDPGPQSAEYRLYTEFDTHFQVDQADMTDPVLSAYAQRHGWVPAPVPPAGSLNAALHVFLGTDEAEKVYLGGMEIWRKP